MKKDTKYVVGTTILTIGCLLGADLYFLFIAIPLIGVGIALIVSSKASNRAKALACTVPFLVPCILLIYALCADIWHLK